MGFRQLLVAMSLFTSAILPARSLSFIGTPSFTASTNAPLAGLLEFKTDTESRVSVRMDDGTEARTRYFPTYATTHSIPLYGFKASRTNTITVSVHGRDPEVTATASPLVFVTGSLPSDFPDIHLLTNDPAEMEPGYSLFIWEAILPGKTIAYSTILDSSGEVVWYSPAGGFDIRQLANGNLFAALTSTFVETDLLGRTVRTWHPPAQPLDPHDGVPTDHGTILYLQNALQTVTDFSTAPYDPSVARGTADIVHQKVIEMSAEDDSLIQAWAPVDVLDPRRVSYLIASLTDGLPSFGWDTEHANAVIEDPSDDSLIVSMRNQNAVIKFSRSTGQLKWILGPHENWGPAWQPYLLQPVGTPFAWQYGQHAPVLTSRGTLMLYDNGNLRASPPAQTVTDPFNYSRAVEYRINEKNMEVSQEWEYGSAHLGEWLYTGYMGNAEPQPKTGNVLIDFSAVSFADGKDSIPAAKGAVMARFKEVTHDAIPKVVFDLTLSKYDRASAGYVNSTVYRVHRIADLYAHPISPVTDLSVQRIDGAVELVFAADETRSYAVQTSPNLDTWTTIETLGAEDFYAGTFHYRDTQSTGTPARYYRILSE